jgi:hypothetical protein
MDQPASCRTGAMVAVFELLSAAIPCAVPKLVTHVVTWGFDHTTRS